MKKYILLVLTAIFIVPSSVFAVSDENVTKKRPDKQTKLEIQEIRQDRKELKEEIQERLQEFRSDVAEHHANRLERRFKFYATRLNNIITRFQTRLDKLKVDEKKNISDSQAKLNIAKTQLASAVTAGENAVKAFRAIDPAKFKEQKAERLAAQTLTKEAVKLFKEAHESLKLALKALKLISKPALPAASAAVQNAQ